MGNNQSLAMNSHCLHVEVGKEFVHRPFHPLRIFIRQIRMIIVDKYGAHLKQLRILRFVRPHPMLSPAGCISIPYYGQEQKVIRFSGHLIGNHHNKTSTKTDVPQFILSTSPITQNDTSIVPTRINAEEIVYKMNIMQNKTEPVLRYFDTTDSRVSFSQIDLFDEEIILTSGDHKYHDFLLKNKTEKHILLNAITSEKYKRADPIVNLKISSILSYINPGIHNIQITVGALQKHHFYERVSKTCVINEMNEECLFMIYSGDDHHIFIQNQNEYPHHINMSFETSHKTIHAEAITVFNHHTQHKHALSHNSHQYQHNHNILAPILFALGIVVGLIGLVAMALVCYRDRMNKDNERLKRLLSNRRRSFFNQVLARNVSDEYDTDTSSI